MMGALKNHRDERVTISVEELVPNDHFLRAVEATIDFKFIEEKLRSVSRAAVCPNAGVSHRRLSKHEKNCPSS